jgi:hypothetical protein
MQFLYPNFLWALLTLTIPIIIHLFNFRRYKTVYFSNVAFLQNIRKETRSRSTLKNLLLLLIRLLAIAFLVLVFARPYIPVNHGIKDTGTPRVVIYIDNSFSMEAEGKSGILLEAAKMKSRQITEAFPYNTQYLLVTNNFELQHQQWITKEQLLSWVSQVQATHVFRTLNQVLERIQTLLPVNDSLIALQTFLLSDFQKNSIDENGNFPLKNSLFYLIAFPNNQTGNLLIDSAWFENPGHYIGKEEQLNVVVRNLSEEKYSDIPIQLFINDTLKASMVFTIEEKSNKAVSIPFTQWISGLNQMKVEISDYPITFDNSFYINFSIRQKNKVLVISESQGIDYFKTLFQDDENFETVSTSSQNIPFNTLSEYELVIINEPSEISTGFITVLITYLKSGGHAVFIPKQEGSINDYNQMLEPLVPIQFEPWLIQKGNVSDPDVTNDLWNSAFKTNIKDSRLPEYQGFFPFRYPSLSGFSVLYKSESGQNLWIKTSVEQGTLFISAIPFSKQITDFATHPLFVPLFYNIALQSTSQSYPFYWLQPATMAKIGLKDYTGETVQITKGGANQELMPRTHYQNGKLLIYPATDQMEAGTYSVIIEDSVVEHISFNYDRRESEITCYTESELKELFKQVGLKQMTFISPESTVLVQDVKNATQGNDLSQLFLWLVLAMFLIEILILKLSK